MPRAARTTTQGELASPTEIFSNCDHSESEVGFTCGDCFISAIVSALASARTGADRTKLIVELYTWGETAPAQRLIKEYIAKNFPDDGHLLTKTIAKLKGKTIDDLAKQAIHDAIERDCARFAKK